MLSLALSRVAMDVRCLDEKAFVGLLSVQSCTGDSPSPERSHWLCRQRFRMPKHGERVKSILEQKSCVASWTQPEALGRVY